MQRFNLKVTRIDTQLSIEASWPSRFISPRPLAFEASCAGIPEIHDLPLDENELQPIGQKFFESVFGGSLGEKYRERLSTAKKMREELALYLELDDQSALLAWELLWDDKNETHYLVLDQYQTLIRSVPTPVQSSYQSGTPLPGLPLSLLHVIASPSEYDPIMPALMSQSLDSLIERKLVVTETLQGENTQHKLHSSALSKEGNRPPITIALIEAHGEIDRGLGEILLCGENNYPTRIRPDQLAIALREFSELRIVIFSCCRSGEATGKFQYGSIARALVANGVPVTIGMNGKILDENAKLFFQYFFESLVSSADPVAVAITKARRKMRQIQGRDSQFYLPSLFSALGSDLVFRPAFDSTVINARYMGIEQVQGVNVREFEPKVVQKTAKISVERIQWTEEGLVIEFEGRMVEDAKRVIKLNASLPEFHFKDLRGNDEHRTANPNANLDLKYGSVLQEKLIISGVPRYARDGWLVFNANRGEGDFESPKIVVKDLVLPPRATRTGLDSLPSITPYSSNPQIDLLTENCSNRAEFIRYCLSGKKEWNNALHWIEVNLLESWAAEQWDDSDLSDYVFFVKNNVQNRNVALWQLLRHLDPSLTLPQLEVETGTNDGVIHFEDFLPTKTTNFYISHHSPSIVLCGQLKPSTDWLHANPRTFNLHSSDGRQSIQISANSFGFLLSRAGKLFSRAKSANIQPTIEIMVDPAYAAHMQFNINDPNALSKDVYSIKIPVEISTDEFLFVSAFVIPVIILLATSILVFFSVSWQLNKLAGILAALDVFAALVLFAWCFPALLQALSSFRKRSKS